MQIDKLIDLINSKKSDRKNWDSFWQEVLQYVAPDKDDVYNQHTGGEIKGELIFDDSPCHYIDLLVSALCTMVVPPDKLYFGMQPSDLALRKNPKVKRWLEALTTKIHDYKNNSNFHVQAQECMHDIVTVGTGNMSLHPDKDDVFFYQTLPIGHYWIIENHKKEVDGIIFEEKFTGPQLLEKYKEKAFTAEQRRMFTEKPNMKHTITQVIIARQAAKYGRLGQMNMPYASYHVWVDEKKVIKEAGYRELPNTVTRWSKRSGEEWGRSPAMKMIHSIRMLQKMMKDVIRAAQKRTDPPMMAPDDGSIANANINPGGFSYYRAGTEDKLFPLNTGSNPSIGMDQVLDTRDQIKRGFFVDKLNLDVGDRATTVEVNANIDEQLKLFGPQLSRFTVEFLKPDIKRCISIMESKNLMPPDRPSELDGVDIDIIFSSQIARAQRLAESGNFLSFVQAASPVLSIQPEAAQNLDGDKAIKYLSGLHGIPEELFRSEEELAEIREAQEDQEARVEDNEAKLQEAQILKDTAAGVQSINQ